MKKIQKNLRGSFNVFSNSARQLEVPLKVPNISKSIAHLSTHLLTLSRYGLTSAIYNIPLSNVKVG